MLVKKRPALAKKLEPARIAEALQDAGKV